MIDILEIRQGRRPLLVTDDGNAIYSWDGRSITKTTIDTEMAIITPSRGFFDLIAGKSTWLSRFLRRGVHHLAIIKDNYVVFRKGKVETYDNEGTLLSVFNDFKGSRPLKVYCDSEILIFGEYWSNKNREEVRIFYSREGIHWCSKVVFGPNSIRHIHGIYHDKYRNKFLILTGDADSESGIFQTSDFVNIDKILSGSQATRAVSLIVEEERFILPMDSPLEPNYIQSFDRSSKKLSRLIWIAGSAFHASIIGGVYFVTTVTEKSETNHTEHAKIYASLDGNSWKEVISLRRDFIPVRFQKVSRYTEINLLDNLYMNRYLIGLGRALKVVSEGMLLWDIDEIIYHLKATHDA